MRERWKSLPIIKVCELFTDGNWIETKDQSPCGIRLIQTGNVGLGEFKDRKNKARFISEDTFLRLKCQEIFAGDCLVSRLPDPVGRSCIVPETEDKMITAVDCTIIRFNQSLLIPEFFNYYSQSKQYLKDVEDQCSGATRKRISRKNLGNVQLPIPPLLEQKRIVAILDEACAGIDTAIANTQKNLANASELFESHLNSMFDDASIDWSHCQLSDICTIKHGFAFKSEYFSDAGPFVVLTPGSFYEHGGFRDQGKKTKYYTGDIPDGYLLREGDFLFAMTEQAEGLLGSSLVVPKSDVYLHNQRLGLVQVRDGIGWSNDFFFHQFNTHRFRAAVQATASGAKVRHTSPKKLGEVMVKFPKLKLEQERVAGVLNGLYAESLRLQSIYQQKLTALTELKQSLLQKAFSGELTAGNVVPITSATKECTASH